LFERETVPSPTSKKFPEPARTKPLSSNILDYPDDMSMDEKESLAAETKLAAEKKIKNRPKATIKSK
jgi:hypothetical protein